MGLFAQLLFGANLFSSMQGTKGEFLDDRDISDCSARVPYCIDRQSRCTFMSRFQFLL